MNQQEAIEKAVKLLRLATSDNPNEAALAASRAQEIIDRYKLGSLSIEYAHSKPTEEIKDFGNDPLTTGNKLSTWEGRLGVVICQLNQCKAYKSMGRLAVVGRPSDVSAVRYLFSWLKREVESLAAKNCHGNGITWANNYKIGVVETVCKRLQETSRQTVQTVKAEAQAEVETGNTMALIRVNQSVEKIAANLAEVEQWAKVKLHLRAAGRTRSRYDSNARETGRRDGHSVRIQPTSGNLGRGCAGYLNS